MSQSVWDRAISWETHHMLIHITNHWWHVTKGDESWIWRVTFVCFYPYPKQNFSEPTTRNIWLLFLKTHVILSSPIPHFCPHCLIPLLSLTNLSCPIPSHQLSACSHMLNAQWVLPIGRGYLSICLHILNLPNQTSKGKPQCLPLPKEKGSKMFSIQFKRILFVKPIWWCWMNWILPSDCLTIHYLIRNCYNFQMEIIQIAFKE